MDMGNLEYKKKYKKEWRELLRMKYNLLEQ
jgi:hypothetical protein